MEHDRAVERREELGRLVVGGAGVDDDGQAELGGERELPLEEPALRVARGVVAVEVEPGLADRDGLRVREQLRELVEPTRLLAAAWCGWMPSAHADAVLAPGDRERRAAGVDSASRPRRRG